MARRTLVTGIGGQDGSYLTELLLERGYEVFGTTLGSAEGKHDGIELIELELTDADAVAAAIRRVKPDETYHLASPSFVPASWETLSAPPPSLLPPRPHFSRGSVVSIPRDGF